MAGAAGQGRRGRGRSWLWAQGLACGIVVATAAPLAAILAVLFAPAALGAMAGPLSGGGSVAEGAGEGAQGAAGQRLGGVMLVYGLAAALPWLEALWSAARNWAMALDILSGLRLVGLCWSAQALAWLLSELTPFIARLVLDAQVRVRESRLREARSRLREEWGMEPAEER